VEERAERGRADRIVTSTSSRMIRDCSHQFHGGPLQCFAGALASIRAVFTPPMRLMTRTSGLSKNTSAFGRRTWACYTLITPGGKPCCLGDLARTRREMGRELEAHDDRVARGDI